MPVLGYLLLVDDCKCVDLDHADGSDTTDNWIRVRHEETLTPEAVVRFTKATHARYGFRDFKLKDGVLGGDDETIITTTLAGAFPETRVILNPNRVWSLTEVIRLCRDRHDVFAHVEDPCGAKGGYSSRKIVVKFRRATDLPTAINVIATSWCQMGHVIQLHPVDTPLTDSYFWAMQDSVYMVRMCDNWGLA